MFSRAQTNLLDDAVAKATDENLTTENWEYILAVCDKVDADPQDGSRHAVAAVQKRLGHRNANVQLYALSLAEALSKNCGSKVHREIASRSFTQSLLSLVNDRTIHQKVKARTAELVKQWSDDFRNDSSLGIMAETMRAMQAQGVKVQAPSKPQKTEISDQDRRREEEELQMALAMSLTETHISAGEAGGASSQAGSSSSRNQIDQGPNAYTLPAQAATSAYTLPTLTSSRTPQGQLHSQPAQQQQHQVQQFQQTPVAERTAATVSRVRALYDFAASEPGELTFHRGDVITVIESAYKDWWRGSLRGTVGIFPTNYVENLPEPTPADLQREAEEERRIFAEAKNVEKLLSILSSADVRDPAIAENDALQQLYHTTIAIRPKLVRLIEKYSQRKDDLILLNEKFVKARKDYDELMEASLSRYNTGAYRQPALPQQHSGGHDLHHGPSGRGSSGYTPGPPGGLPVQHSGPYQPAQQHEGLGQYYVSQHPHEQSPMPHYSPQQQQRPPHQAGASSGSMSHVSPLPAQPSQQGRVAYSPGQQTSQISHTYLQPSPSNQYAAQTTPYPKEPSIVQTQRPILQASSPSQELTQTFPSMHGLSSPRSQPSLHTGGTYDVARYEKEGGPPVSYYTQAPDHEQSHAVEEDEDGEGSPVDAYGAIQDHARKSQTSLHHQAAVPTGNVWAEPSVETNQASASYDSHGQADFNATGAHPGQGPSNPEDFYS